MAASEGVDLEWAIVEKIKIKNNEQKKYTKDYSEIILSQADDCVKHIYKYAGSAKKVLAWHSDDSSNPFGVAIAAKPEPKTDVVLKIGTKIHTVSVKMAGGVQLASGQGASTAELFAAAATKVPNSNKSKVLKSIISELKVMPTRLLSESNKKRILTEAKPKVIQEFIKGTKIIQDKSYEYWLSNNKEVLMDSLLKYIAGDPEYTKALLYEALTGEISLAEYKGAVADSIISPKGFYLINDTYVQGIRSKVKFDIRGKSRSGITGLAFRIDLKA
jgi:hypothetical protein